MLPNKILKATFILTFPIAQVHVGFHASRPHLDFEAAVMLQRCLRDSAKPLIRVSGVCAQAATCPLRENRLEVLPKKKSHGKQQSVCFRL